MTIFNEMCRRRPDSPRFLRAIETDRARRIPQGRQPYFSIPVFNWNAGLLTAIYHRPYIESAGPAFSFRLSHEPIEEPLQLLEAKR